MISSLAEETSANIDPEHAEDGSDAHSIGDDAVKSWPV
jgi:hypothetical protein